jgi:hypothetical protein
MTPAAIQAVEKPDTVAELYYTSLNYSDSQNKNDGYSTVFYTNLPFENYRNLELGFGKTGIEYSDGTADLEQLDFTLMYSDSGNIINNTTTRFGFHVIKDKEGTSGGVNTLLTDFTYYKNYPENYGFELIYSDYSNSLVGNIIQIAPHYGKWLRPSSSPNSLYFEAKATVIKSIHAAKSGLPNRTWNSLEFSLSGKIKEWDHKTSVWIGERVYMVDNAGFTVYNLSDRYLGGISANLGYRFSRNFRVGLGAAWQTYKESISNKRVDSTTANLVLTCYF